MRMESVSRVRNFQHDRLPYRFAEITSQSAIGAAEAKYINFHPPQVAFLSKMHVIKSLSSRIEADSSQSPQKILSATRTFNIISKRDKVSLIRLAGKSLTQ